jgi:DNA-binding NarL/FixJ family response regulator
MPPNPRLTADLTPATSPYPASLTEREVEVLRLLTQGLTDPQIADQLMISPCTVHAHLQTIYKKLEVRRRSEATRFAVGAQPRLIVQPA